MGLLSSPNQLPVKGASSGTPVRRTGPGPEGGSRNCWPRVPCCQNPDRSGTSISAWAVTTPQNSSPADNAPVARRMFLNPSYNATPRTASITPGAALRFPNSLASHRCRKAADVVRNAPTPALVLCTANPLTVMPSRIGAEKSQLRELAQQEPHQERMGVEGAAEQGRGIG